MKPDRSRLSEAVAALQQIKLPAVRTESSFRTSGPLSQSGSAMQVYAGNSPPLSSEFLSQPAPALRADTGAALTFGSQQWAPELGDKLLMLVSNRQQTAEIQLDPPDLGPLRVQVRVSHDQTSILFSSHSAAVRDALEQAVPRLREMFDQNGLGLGDVNVRDQGKQDDRGGRMLGQQGEAGFFTDEAEVIDEAPAVQVRSLGLVDYYA
jgi:flagellar hook-length control protein FliK